MFREKKAFVCGEDYPLAETSSGKIRGFLDGDVFCFRGIPYARAERFGMPEPYPGWTGIRDALDYGCGCPEMTYSLEGKEPQDELLCPKRFWNMSEDCLNLNIWTKSLDSAQKCPVMVWFHGGGFFGGSATQLFSYDGWEMAHQYDVVLVTVNHRLNMLGFLDLSDFGEKYEHSGNAGMADLVAALRWVRANIVSFGGDPDNVTIYGQSGGGAKVSTLMQMSSADGLYHRAIIQSGIIRGAFQAGDGKRRVRRAVELLGLNKNSIDEIRTLPYEKVAAAVRQACAENGEELFMCWAPVPDGDFYIGTPQEKGFREENAGIPMIVGSCLAEFDPSPRGDKTGWTQEQRIREIQKRFGDKAEAVERAWIEAYPELDSSYAACLDTRVRPAVLEFLNQRVRMAKAPVYNYIFTFESSLYGGMLPGHNADLHFMFHNALYAESMYRETVTEYVQDAMAGAWAQFAYGGTPNAPGLNVWEPYEEEKRACMIFGENPGMRCEHDKRLLELAEEG